jgi:Motility quorum-sensing regulator, toxin of MqsA
LSGWLPRLLRRVHELAAARRISLTLKAATELAALDLGLDAEDLCDVLVRLASEDFADKIVSKTTGEPMYVFKPKISGSIIYLKLIVRQTCVVVSFHEDQGESGGAP